MNCSYVKTLWVLMDVQFLESMQLDASWLKVINAWDHRTIIQQELSKKTRQRLSLSFSPFGIGREIWFRIFRDECKTLNWQYTLLQNKESSLERTLETAD